LMQVYSWEVIPDFVVRVRTQSKLRFPNGKAEKLCTYRVIAEFVASGPQEILQNFNCGKKNLVIHLLQFV
jgi:hypothetical protein